MKMFGWTSENEKFVRFQKISKHFIQKKGMKRVEYFFGKKKSFLPFLMAIIRIESVHWKKKKREKWKINYPFSFATSDF